MNENETNQHNLESPEEMQQLDNTNVSEERSMGAVLGSIIVVIILLIAAFYLWGNRPETPAPIVDEGPTAEEVLQQDDPQAETLATQSDSDELDAIEADLDVDLGNLTEELDTMDKELGL
jgi:uncharacterized membrane protein YvbJ